MYEPIFNLRIYLGNEAMQTGYDISLALRDLADKIENGDNLKGDYGKVMDLNGNTVGSWQVK